MSAAAATIMPIQTGGATPPPPLPKTPRACPDDFDATYIAWGYDECEVIFRAAPMTVKRWLLERGAERLRKARAEFVARERAAKRALKAMRTTGVAVPPELVSEAANFLRTMRNGGWFVAPTGRGDWWLGTMHKTPAQIVEFAAARGWDMEGAMARQRLAVCDEARP
jgi:hypothetical protein